MKIWRSSLLIIGLSVLVLSGFSVSAETITDGTNDIYHWHYSETSWNWEYNTGGKPNIDITQVTYTISGNQLILTLVVDGAIEDSELISYFAYYNSDSEESSYWMSYTNGEGLSMYSSANGGGMGITPTVSGNTLSCTFDDFVGDSADFEAYGFAYQYSDTGNEATSEHWSDYAPDSYFEGDDSGSTPSGSGSDDYDDSGSGNGETGGGNNNRPSTPGFETLAVIAAIGVAFIILRRRK